jgi:hypothetical protein
MSKMSLKKFVTVKAFDEKKTSYVNLSPNLNIPVILLLAYFDLKDYCTFQRINKSWSKLSLLPFPHNVYASNFHTKHKDFTHYLRYVTHLHEINHSFLSSIKLDRSHNKYNFIANLPNLRSINFSFHTHDTKDQVNWLMRTPQIKKLKEIKYYYVGDEDGITGSGNWQYGTHPIPKMKMYTSKLYLSAFPVGSNIVNMYSNLEILRVSNINYSELKQIMMLPKLKELQILNYTNNDTNDYYAEDGIDWSEVSNSKTLLKFKMDIRLHLGSFISWFMRSKIKDLTVASITKSERRSGLNDKYVDNENKMLDNPDFLLFLKDKVLRDGNGSIYFTRIPDHIKDGVFEKYNHEICPYTCAPEDHQHSVDNGRINDKEDKEYWDRYNKYEEMVQKQLLQIEDKDEDDLFGNVNSQSLLYKKAYSQNIIKICLHKKLDDVYSTIKKLALYTYVIEKWKPEDFTRQFPNLIMLRLTWDFELEDAGIKLTKDRLDYIYDFVLRCLKLNSRLYVKLKYDDLQQLIVRFPLAYGSRIYC